MHNSIADSCLNFIIPENQNLLSFFLFQKWHPDKKKEESATSRFQEINEAYKGKCSTTVNSYFPNPS